MSYQDEFSQNMIADMPAIPAHWRDISYGNDVCPSFEAQRAGPCSLRVWVDALERRHREYPDGRRFTVVLCHDDNSDDLELYSHETNWQAVLDFTQYFALGSADHLALVFCEEISETLDEHELAIVNQRNDEEETGACHSHDFCDANVVMLDSLKRCGLTPDLSEEQAKLVNDAWWTARLSRFEAENVLAG